MNERIKELAKQAEKLADIESKAFTDNTGKWRLIWNEVYDKNFAELIVRETLDQVDEFSRLTKAYQTQGIDPEIDVTKEVLKNFGFPRFPRS